jgi:hypothetical protein
MFLWWPRPTSWPCSHRGPTSFGGAHRPGRGWRPAFWASLGIAAPTGVHRPRAGRPVAAAAGQPVALPCRRPAGCTCSIWLDELALRKGHAEAPTARNALHPAPRHARACFWPGLWSGLLEPEERPVLTPAWRRCWGPDVSVGWKWLTGLWMVLAVPGWDDAGGQRAGATPRCAAVSPARCRGWSGPAALRWPPGAAVCVAAGWRR